jgi:hypothetical protein
MPRKQPTKAERQHLDRVARLGCIVCGRPAEIHHLLNGAGMGQRADNYTCIPLCQAHHRTGGHGVAIHAGKKTWEQRFGTELELLERTRELLEEAA